MPSQYIHTVTRFQKKNHQKNILKINPDSSL